MANALFPAPPRQTVHSVFSRHGGTFRSSSSRGFRSLSPWSGGWNLVEIQILIKVLIWILAIASVFLRLLPSQVDAYSLFQKPFDHGQVLATVPIVKVTDPSPSPNPPENRSGEYIEPVPANTNLPRKQPIYIGSEKDDQTVGVAN